VLVTGQAGYIEQVMVRVLERAGHSVTGCGIDYYEGCNFGEVNHHIPILRKDIRDLAPKDLVGFDAVIHLAALSNDPLGDLDLELTLEINYKASVRFARLARNAGIRRFLYSSSCSMYGSAGDNLMAETAPLRSIAVYAESKVRTEEVLDELACNGFSPVYLRNATAHSVSPRLRADLALNNLCCWARTRAITGGFFSDPKRATRLATSMDRARRCGRAHSHFPSDRHGQRGLRSLAVHSARPA
jgi:nucleoside-diphosphate-sugar epimerase